ncbi:MAG: peptide-methionine (S)-S-oxide reductase [Chthoniobacterales bacterium]
MKLLFGFLITMTFAISSLTAEPPATARVVFAQSCFWTGEMQLGQIDGVTRTEAGFFQGHEVTLVDYDPARVSLERLTAQARAAGVADRLYLPASSARASAVAGVPVGAPLDQSYRIAPASDQKKQIEGTRFARLKLSPEVATKVNAFVRVDPARALQSLGPAERAQVASSR